MGTQGFLRSLGQRLRQARERTDTSLSAIAREAGVSRRYLTEAEAGRANPSIIVLARLSSALGVPLQDIVDLELRSRPSERVALVGLRGAGKTTLGRSLALQLEAPLVELDERIEGIAGLSLAEIFDLHGTAAFRRFEAEALEEVLSEGERLVIATGGSIVTHPGNFTRLLETCRTIWLRASPEAHYARVLAQGDQRPMQNRPRAMEELEALLDKRAPLYRRCELSVDTETGSVAELIETLTKCLLET